MDDYPAGDPIPDPNVFELQHNELVQFLTNSREMRRTAKSSFKQAAYAGGEFFVYSALLVGYFVALLVCCLSFFLSHADVATSIVPFSTLGGAIAGGFLLGPVGGMVGGIVGSIIGFFQSDNYDGALLAICKLDEAQKKTLMTRVGQILIASGATAQQL